MAASRTCACIKCCWCRTPARILFRVHTARFSFVTYSHHRQVLDILFSFSIWCLPLVCVRDLALGLGLVLEWRNTGMNECCYNQGKGKSECRWLWLCDCVCCACGRRLARYVDGPLSNPGTFIIFQMRAHSCNQEVSAQSCPSASLFNRGACFHTGRAANTKLRLHC